MEKRKWSWKKKSSERSPCESESSGSISSCSDSLCDEQDELRESPNNGMQSSEVTSESPTINDEVKEHLRSLTEKLSAALVNVSAKEDLVKQHAKVAEEAVAGWEKAENEVAVLKQQLETVVQQNLKLEVRVSHLDGALKECVRQLRQARDEQEQIISVAVFEKTSDWELTKAELDKQILELQEQVEAARAEISTSILEVTQKENTSLKRELESRCKELEIIMMERDFSTQAAETASKQQLESKKKIAKLESECRKLQAAARKSSPANDHKCVATSSSSYAESETDSHSDGGERTITLDLEAYDRKRNGYKASALDSWSSVLISELDNCKNEKPKSLTVATRDVEIDVMDDFLEMERLVVLGDTKTCTISAETEAASGESIYVDSHLKGQLEKAIKLVTDMEKKLENIEAEKLKLERALDDSHVALNASKVMLVESEIWLEELQKELAAVKEAKESLEYQLINIEAEARTMTTCVDSVKAKNEKERSIAAEFKVKCQELKMELQQAKAEVRLDELQKELTSVNEAKESLENQLINMEADSRTMSSCVDSLKAEIEREKSIAAEFKVKCQELEMEQAKTEVRLGELQKELAVVNEAKKSLENQLISMEAEARTMSSCVDSYKAEIEKERSIAAAFKVKCQELEMELQQTTTSNGELKLKKEDLVVAADKLAECQKTIASLGKQLQSLAILENFLIDTSNMSGMSSKALLSRSEEVYWSPYNDVNVPKDGLNLSRILMGSCSHLVNGNSEESPPFSSSSTSANIQHRLPRIGMDSGSFSCEARAISKSTIFNTSH